MPKQITFVCIIIEEKVNNMYTSCFLKIEHFNKKMFGIALYFIQWYNNSVNENVLRDCYRIGEAIVFLGR